MNRLFLIGAFAAWLANQWLLKSSGLEFFHSHFNDVLAGFILLAWSNLLATPVRGVGLWVASPWGAAVIIGGAGAVWELGAPQLLAHSQSDPLDVLAYFVGGAVYFLAAALAAPAPARL